RRAPRDTGDPTAMTYPPPPAQRGRRCALLAAAAGAALSLAAATAQDAAPPADAGAAAPAAAKAPARDSLNRRVAPDDLAPLPFETASVADLVPFIAEVTGKVVLPHEPTLISRITILSDTPVTRSRALDMIFLALHQQGIAVVETDDLIMLRNIDDLARQDIPVIGPFDSVL